MDDVFRRALQQKTRRIVSGYSRPRSHWWALALGSAAVLAAILLLCRPFGDYPNHPVRKINSAGAGHPRQPVPSVEHGRTQLQARESPKAPRERSRVWEAAQRAPGAAPAVERNTQEWGDGTRGMVSNADTRRVPAPENESVLKVRPPADPVLAVVAVRPPVTDAAGSEIKPGARIAAGSVVRTGNGGRVTVVTRGGSQLDLDSKSELSLSDDGTATLASGRIYCSNRGHEISTIDTPAGRIGLLGTVVDAAVLKGDAVAVTVVEGRVELTNSLGKAVVDAGRRSVLTASSPPRSGDRVNTFAETAWCDRRGDVESDFGEITFTVEREKGLLTEVWVMNTDGSGRRRVRSFVGQVLGLGPWMPAERWLLAETISAGYRAPDLQARRALSTPSEEIMSKQKWFLNTATGQNLPMLVPTAYVPSSMSFSPDGRWIALAAEEHYEPRNWTRIRHGAYLYNLQTGTISRLAEGFCASAPSWAADSRRLVAAIRGDSPERQRERLVLVDVETLQTTDLGVEGLMPTLSPDGKRVAYCAPADPGTASASCDRPAGARLCVIELGSGAVRRLTPEASVAMSPRWSPDGSRILFYFRPSRDSGLYVCRADGSDLRPVCPNDGSGDIHLTFTVGSSPCFGWARSGDAVHVASDRGVLAYAADGSGLKADLGDSHGSSGLSAEEKSQTDAAVADLHEAIFQYALGMVRAFEANVDESRQAFQAAAGIFSELMWRYPLAGLGANDVLRYADKAQLLASRTDDQVIADSCWEHMRYIRGFLARWGDEKAVPKDMATLQRWAPGNPKAQINWLEPTDTEHIQMVFQCPGSPPSEPARYVYHPPENGDLPSLRHIMVTCPIHREHTIMWWNCDAYGHGFGPRPMIFPWRAPYSH